MYLDYEIFFVRDYIYVHTNFSSYSMQNLLDRKKNAASGGSMFRGNALVSKSAYMVDEIHL